MHVFHCRQTGSHFPVKDMIPNLDYFKRFAVAVPNYNSSLHGMDDNLVLTGAKRLKVRC